MLNNDVGPMITTVGGPTFIANIIKSLSGNIANFGPVSVVGRLLLHLDMSIEAYIGRRPEMPSLHWDLLG